MMDYTKETDVRRSARNDRIDGRIREMAGRMVLLGARVYCAKKARKSYSQDATSEVRDQEFNKQLDELMATLAHRQEDNKFASAIDGIRKEVDLLRGSEGYMLKGQLDSDMVGRAPFGRMEYMTFRTIYSNLPSVWSRADLNSIIGLDPATLYRTFNSILKGSHGEYWLSRLNELQVSSINNGFRYKDDIFALYLIFRQYQYIASLKEARKCGRKPEDFKQCALEDLDAFKNILDYCNDKMISNGLPRVECWDDIINERLNNGQEQEQER